MTEKNIEDRKSFCETQLNGTINWEENVIFSDESRFCQRDDSRRVWVKRGVYNLSTFTNEKKYEKGIMVWGSIGKNWISPLIRVDGTLTADGYIKLLQDNNIFESLDET